MSEWSAPADGTRGPDGGHWWGGRYFHGCTLLPVSVGPRHVLRDQHGPVEPDRGASSRWDPRARALVGSPRHRLELPAWYVLAPGAVELIDEIARAKFPGRGATGGTGLPAGPTTSRTRSEEDT